MKEKGIVATYKLQNVSLFVMNPGMQESYTHEIPRTKTKVGGRVNITLRQHQSK